MRSMARPGQNLHVKNLVFVVLYLIIMAVEAQLIRSTNRYLRASTISLAATQGNNGRSFDVQNYGAVGDGEHDDTEAFTRAWNDACKASSATLNVPGGKAFLVNNLNFQGPCQPGFTLQVDGTIVAPENPSSWKSTYVWLLFEHLQKFTLTGKGTIDGKGSNWWGKQKSRPTAIQFNDVKGSALSGLKVTNSPQFHVTLTNCDSVQIVGITIQAPESSPNTDGIDTFESTNIVIKDSTIGTGDDCVGIGDGSSNININDITCGPGHGISIGSLGRGNTKADVHSIHVNGAKLTSTTNGLRIKTWPGGSGVASDITYENVQMEDVSNPIIINQFYCDTGDTGSGCKSQGSAVKISNVEYSNIRGTSATEDGITLSCSQSGSCTGITMENIDLVTGSGAQVACNAQNVQGGNSIPSRCLGNNGQ
ncbi:polygalacturonase-like [Cryptomeria japonica]|nr:polygalacturonase-like [Cryptomeria japonica]XP_059071101.1 polygalacturonase-like [Cryptomeria japonica]